MELEMNGKKSLKFISMMIALIIAMMLAFTACTSPNEGETDVNYGDVLTERRDVNRDNPAEYFAATWEYTMQVLGQELKSLGDNRVFSQIGDIFISGEFDIEILVNPNSFMGYDAGLPTLVGNLSNSAQNRAFALTANVEEMIDLGFFITETDIILSLLGENISVNAADFFDEIMAFSAQNDLGLEHEIDMAMLGEMGITGFTYSELFLGPTGNWNTSDSLSDETMNRLTQLSDALVSNFTYSITDETVDFVGVQGDVIITTVTVPMDDINTFISEALITIVEDEYIQASMLASDLVMADIYVAIDELATLEEDAVIQFIERDGRYIAIRVEDSEGYALEIGATGDVNMLDNFYVSFIGSSNDSFFFSMVGNNVNTNHYRTAVTIRTDFDTIMFNFEWDTTAASDNFVLDMHALGNLRGTFAVAGNDVVISLSQVRVAGETLAFEEGDFKITIGGLTGAIDVPTNLRPLRDMSMFDIEMLIMPLVFALM